MSQQSSRSQSDMKKVLVVAHAFPPFRSVGHSIRVAKFIKYLPELGWLPVVLTIDDQEEYEDYRKQGSASLLADIPSSVRVYRTATGEPSLSYLEKEKAFAHRNRLTSLCVKIFGGARRWAFRNIVLPDRRAVWIPFAVRCGVQIIKNEGVDVIFTTCPPHSATLVGALLKKLTSKPLVLDFRDDWIDTPSYAARLRTIQRIERKVEQWVIKTSDTVVLVTEESKKAFLTRYPAESKDKFVLIPNGCDLEQYAVSEAVSTTTQRSEFTIVHAGSLNDSVIWTRTPETLFEAAHRILTSDPQMADRLRLVFTGTLPDRLHQLAQNAGLSKVVVQTGFLAHADLLSLFQSAGMLLVINYEGYATLIPGKIYEYWAVGGPPILLLSCPGAAVNLLERFKLGIAVEPSDVTGIQQAILSVYCQSKTATPLRISTSGIEAYDRRVLASALAGVLSEVSHSYIEESE